MNSPAAGKFYQFPNFFEVRRIIFLLMSVIGLLPSSRAGENTDFEFPSPDGLLAFRTTSTREHYALDLVSKAGGKLVCKVMDSDEYGPRLKSDVLWSPDSKSFAFSSSEVRLSTSVSVFVRDGESFREVELPELADPRIPAKYEGDERLHHWVAIGMWDPVCWRKDGSLEVRGFCGRDGNEFSVDVRRTVVLAPAKSGKWKILSSNQKVTAHFE